MNFFKRHIGVTVSAAVFTALCIAPASALQLKMLKSWDPSYIGSKEIADRFITNLGDAAKGEVSITTMGPEAVPPFEQLQPVAAGVFDMLFTHGAYHFGDTGVAMAMDAVVGTPQQVRDSGLWEIVDKHYQKRGLKLISLPTMGSGYHIILRQPVGNSGDLGGRKIRATPVYHGMLNALNASAVVLPGGEIYSALERGVVDGAAWPAIGILDFRWNEVAQHFLRPTFGAVAHQVFMNLDKWKSLSPKEQELLLREGAELEHEVYALFQQKAKEEDAALRAAGMTETRLSQEYIAKLDKLWADGVWSVAAQKGGTEVENLRRSALAAGLTK